MSKKEIIWREILYQATEKKKFEFTQKELASELHVSLSTVFNALKVPRQSGAIKVTGRNFIASDVEKFMYIWATQRNLEKETIYSTSVAANPPEIEGMVPPNIMFACYSAYSKKYQNSPADYDKVYIYSDIDQLVEVKKRFPPQKGYVNVVVLKSDSHLKKFGGLTPDVQTFVDVWNLKDWYAKEFLSALRRKIFT